MQAKRQQRRRVLTRGGNHPTSEARHECILSRRVDTGDCGNHIEGKFQLSHREVDPIDEKLRPLQSENKQIFGPIYSRKGGDLLRSRPVPRNMSTVTYGRLTNLSAVSIV